ncbi:ABC transporter substrate-binding protein, partial [Candidatus Peregrinibacteria bacterium]|nr:ABC transporter substrate-binding protein [Candidatus Peregrinibacteria bacterium]
IKIGYIGPLTGDAASFGNDNLHGAQIAVDEVNAAGGINGQQVELIAEDGRCNGSDAASAAQKLVNVDHVVAIIGGQCSSETLAAAPIVEAAHVVLISPVSSSPDITHAGDYVFRNYPSDGLKGKALGTYLKKAAFKKLAIISENTDFCQGIRSSVAKDLPSGVTIVFDELVDPGTKDYRSLMTRLKKTDFDVFLANGQSDATDAAMVTQLRELGMKQQIVGTDTADSANLGKIATKAVEGMKALSVPSLRATGSGSTPADAFVRTFRGKYGEAQQSMFFAALSYDATNVILRPIGQVGMDGTKIKDALYAMPPYHGIAGTFSFDSNGDVLGIPFAMKVFKKGVLMQAELIPIESSAMTESSSSIKVEKAL